MKIKKFIILLLITIPVLTYILYEKGIIPDPDLEVGTAIDSFNGVKVYYNGSFSNVNGRNISDDGYNIGLKYQCVEFVKRYYYKVYQHKMPNSYGNAVDFFNKSLVDNTYNPDRGLIQYTNPSHFKPQIGDLLIYNSTSSNKFGHVAIVCNVKGNSLEVIQQNTGGKNRSRDSYKLLNINNLYKIDNERILGFLRCR